MARRRRKVDGVTTAAWRRLALAHLDSAMLGRCMIHEECAAIPDLGRRCFSAQMSAHLSAIGQAAREQDWLWGLHCPRCKIDRRRGNRAHKAVVSHHWCPRSRERVGTPPVWLVLLGITVAAEEGA